MYTRDRPFHAPRRKTPSFSSSLLEAIYRSIDESEGQDECSSYYGEGFGASARKQRVRGGYDRNSASAPSSAGRRGFTSLERVIMIEEWMEKQGSRSRFGSSRINSGSSSSGSSSGGRMGACSLSSSEAELGRRKHRLPTNDDGGGGREKAKKNDRNEDSGGRISRTKLGALKIYGELKKVKQPILRGGKISSFLNSIFNSGNVKKAKMCYVGAADDVTIFDRKATLSTTIPSCSKPCMSKTPSTRKHSPDDGSSTKQSQRSMRFYPQEAVAVTGDNNIPEPFGYRTVLRSCPSYKEKDFATKTKRDPRLGDHVHVHEDEGYDGLSCSSSDLFELGDHLMGNYGEELPVYETTSFKRNQAIIAHGFTF